MTPGHIEVSMEWLLGGLLTLGYLVLGLYVRDAIASLRTYLEQARAEDRENMREWINGSFLRAGVADAKLTDLSHGLERIEGTVERIDEHGCSAFRSAHRKEA